MSSCAAICSLLLELQVERQKSVSQSVCSRFSVLAMVEDDKTDSESSSDVGISLSLDCDSLWLLLPTQLRDAFGSERVPAANILSNFFADRADLESFASVHCPADAGVSISHTCSILSTLVARASEQACRVHKRRALVPDSAKFLAVSLASGVKRLRTDVVPEFSRAWLRKRSGPITVRRWRHRLDKRLASTSCTSSRQEMERQELQRWQIVLADLVKEAGLPVVEHMKLVRFPESMLLAALGSARAATVRKHVREWKKVKLYCLATSGKAWPQHVGFASRLSARAISGALCPHGAAGDSCQFVIHGESWRSCF